MIMNKSLYIVAFSLAFATTGIAQNNEGQDKVIDLGTQTTTELRKTQAVSTIYSNELDKNAATSPYNAIYGLLPGLSVMQNTSWGTDKSRLNVRGRGSLNGDTPLFVVDGFARPL
ncbi:tonB-dependent Receptor Plug domain protein, partial [Bacteroides fragilis str. 3397 T10]